jgi:site-specific DNA-methyltransferase (adenine-specific)
LKPYYQQDGITIYHGDCREVLPTLGPRIVDLVVTDPPYGVRWRSNHRSERFDFLTGDDSEDAAISSVGLIVRCLKRFAHLYFFGRFDFQSPFLSEPVELIWDKYMTNSGDLQSPWGNQHEYIQFHVYDSSKQNVSEGKGRLSARIRKGTVLRVPRLNSGAVTHPTEKPVRLLRELIESSSCIDDLVLDCFSGVGSTLEAARIEGRQAIGIEIEERYCEIAAKRLAQGVLPLCGVTR